MGSWRDDHGGARCHDQTAGLQFSVVVPVCNGARFLEAALESVTRQMLDA